MRAKHTAQLPPTPCPPEMRAAAMKVAAENNISLAEVTRRALSVFLAHSVGYTDKIDSLTDNVLKVVREAESA